MAAFGDRLAAGVIVEGKTKQVSLPAAKGIGCVAATRRARLRVQIVVAFPSLPHGSTTFSGSAP